ncbi:MAG: hypothetical protein ACYTGQ_15005, partial [Planctomycetota bacterium]
VLGMSGDPVAGDWFVLTAVFLIAPGDVSVPSTQRSELQKPQSGVPLVEEPATWPIYCDKTL